MNAPYRAVIASSLFLTLATSCLGQEGDAGATLDALETREGPDVGADARDTREGDTDTTDATDTTDTTLRDTGAVDVDASDTAPAPDTQASDVDAADAVTLDTRDADATDALDTSSPVDSADTSEADTGEGETSEGPGTLDTSSTSDASGDTAPDTWVEPVVLPPADRSQLLAPPYLMWVTQHEVSVRWETKTAVIGSVEYGPSDALGTTLVEPAATKSHELRLTGLPADHLSSYRVIYGGGALPVRHFRTAPPDDTDTPLRFIVWGDNQDGPGTFSDLIPWMGDFDPRFAFSVGDCVQNGTRNEYRSQLFGPLDGFADEVPFLVAAGNHERYFDSSASLFDEYLSQPGNEHCFGWRYGGLFVLFLDTDLGLDGAAQQRACITEALSSDAATSAQIRAAAFHKPPRIEWWVGGRLAFNADMEAPFVRKELEPLLESFDVDIVFNGHNHLYAYTPETPGGITWVTTGGGGGSLDVRGLFDWWRVGTWPQIQTTIHEHHFLRATLEGAQLTVEAVDLQGTVLHSFTVAP